jgi:hypothetical protein
MVVAGHEAGLLMLQKIARHKERLGYQHPPLPRRLRSGRRLAPPNFRFLLLHLQGRRLHVSLQDLHQSGARPGRRSHHNPIPVCITIIL